MNPSRRSARRPAKRPVGFRETLRAWERRLLVGGALTCAVALGALLGPSLRAVFGDGLRGPRFQIQSVSVFGSHRLPAEEIVAIAGVSAGTPLLDLDMDALEARLRAHPRLADARALRVPPRCLVVGVRERVPRALVRAGEPARLHLVDAEGRAYAPLAPGDPGELPLLRAVTPPVPGEPHAELARAVALLDALDRRGFAPPSEVTLSPHGALHLRLRGLGARVVLTGDDADVALDRLVRLVGQHAREVLTARSIDLRFEDRAILRSARVPGGTLNVVARRGYAGTPKPTRSGNPAGLTRGGESTWDARMT